MAKAHCKKHKRFVPTCDPCKSAALKETVGFPGGRAEPESEETNDTGAYVGGGSSESVNDIPEYEPDEEEDVEPGPAMDGPPLDPPILYEPKDIDETEAAMEEAGEFDPASHPVTPEEDMSGPTQMSPIDMAMFMFPRRLIPEGATEVTDLERPDEPYMASYEELVRRAVEGYLGLGLSPEDANIVVAADIIKNNQLNFLPVEDEDALSEEEIEAFDAGLEAAPGITGCIEDYNQGFNEGMSALHRLMLDYYAGDEDTVAYAMMRWVETRMVEMRK